MASNNIYGNYGPPPNMPTLVKQQQGVPRYLPQPAVQQAARPVLSLANSLRQSNAWKSLTENEKSRLKITSGHGRSYRGSKRAKRNRSRRSHSRRSHSRRNRRK